MINTGDTDINAKAKIIKKFNDSKHKRMEIPKYTFERNNYLLKMEEE